MKILEHQLEHALYSAGSRKTIRNYNSKAEEEPYPLSASYDTTEGRSICQAEYGYA